MMSKVVRMLCEGGLAATLCLSISVVPIARAQQCGGDCNDDCSVGIDELMRGVRISLGRTDVSACPEIDLDGNDVAEVNELVFAVGNALGGCALDECSTAPDIVARATHNFGETALAPHQEIASQCVAWTLNNDEALYVNEIVLSNGGAYHHSNWFVVPEDLYPGPDGFFRCRDRDFEELASAVSGTVIFAQSTQSQAETQQLARGAVIKIPPRHKVVAGVHMLNLQAREHRTFLRMTLGLVHPSDVDVILSPFRLSYGSLEIPANSDAHFSADCDLATPFQSIAKKPLDIKLYWVLPHYHELGNFFRVEISGGPQDGLLIHSLDTFNAEPNGKAFDPPIDLTGADGLRFTCGFSNPRDRSVGWGIGDQEMCVMLGLADSAALMDAFAFGENFVDGPDENGVVQNRAECVAIGLPRNVAQGLPTAEERNAPLYVPESLPDDVDLPPVPPCVDTPESTLAEQPATLSSLRETVFRGSCTFQACHDNVAPAAGLDLASDGVHDSLLSHRILFGETDLPLIAPGDPDGSWIMTLLSRCEPQDDVGTVLNHMPRNSPSLLPPELVAKVRDWILTGAEDN